ncbi:hypothetical protein EIKCOROL_00877 [Eikenella corrodens ATCC 23834]|uniref:Uncharacterized protein n=1 Tax=Eikenella corrodens ATCC 23834 TaxID=546274 RepID=C0DU46_EIKCO|nr:hypothetical protein EIKCOROL_00877 [Eikenella corrodens ATCC 23834]
MKIGKEPAEELVGKKTKLSGSPNWLLGLPENRHQRLKKISM